MGDDFLCPRCNVSLAAVEDRDVPFMGCQKCYGLFVSEPDLFVYIEKAGSPRVFASFVELHERMLNGKKAPGTMLRVSKNAEGNEAAFDHAA